MCLFIGWHFGAPFDAILVENVYDWMAWALFSSRPDELNHKERSEMKALVKRLEDEKVGHPFPPGRNPAITCPRISLGTDHRFTFFSLGVYLLFSSTDGARCRSGESVASTIGSVYMYAYSMVTWGTSLAS